MTTCPNCTAAAASQHHGFTAGCKGCAARAAARSPHHRRVRDAGKLDRPYLAMCEQYGVTHEEVKAAAALDVHWPREVVSA